MKSYKIYIFDFDDTLVNTFNEVSNNHYPKLARELNLELPEIKKIRKNWNGDLEISLQKIFGNKHNSKVLLKTLLNIYKGNPVSPVENAVAIIKKLKLFNKRICIVSSRKKDFIIKGIQESLKLDPNIFDIVYSTVDNNIEKPNTKIFSNIIGKLEERERTEISLKDIVFLGDSLEDYLTVKDIPIDFIAITNGIHRGNDFISTGLNRKNIFPSLAQAFVPPESHGIVALIKNEKDEFLFVQEGRENNPYYKAWSGPHGKCQVEDIIEEVTVTREIFEECGLKIFPKKRIFVREADTKVKTVAFWETEKINSIDIYKTKLDKREVSDIRWFSLEEISNGNVFLYPGTKDYFNRLTKNSFNEKKIMEEVL